MRRKEVLFAVIGGVVGAVLVMVAGQLSPRVGRIACTDLEVVDSKGNPRVRLSAGEWSTRRAIPVCARRRRRVSRRIRGARGSLCGR